VVVGESWRRAGLATRMLLGLAEFAAANGLEQVQAEILQENAAALRLVTKFDAGILAPMSCGSPGRSPRRGRVAEVGRGQTPVSRRLMFSMRARLRSPSTPPEQAASLKADTGKVRQADLRKL
jgi:hypothetical protein